MTEPALIADIEGYASIFDVADLNGDIIAPGAFAKSLKANPAIRMLYQHGAETPIGRWLSFRQDARGLFVRGELILSSPRAREVHALLAGGAIDGLSIGYQTVRSVRTQKGRRITEAQLWEVSVVTFPMAPAARVTRIGPPQPADDPARSARLFSESAVPAAARAPALPSPPRPPKPGAGTRLFADALRSAADQLSV